MPRRPKLGQHFLADTGFRQRIVKVLDVRPDEIVIEIGPGRGAMTELLVARARRVVGIEVDTSLASGLAQKLALNRQIEILCADVLSTDFRQLRERLAADRFFVFGNLPYYLTSPIIHHLFSYRDCIRALGLLLQREVARRIVAVPGTRAYGYLSVLAQLYTRPRLLFSIPPGAFAPPPKVYSALVSLTMRPDTAAALRIDSPEELLKFVKCCFAHKRKNLLNNLGGVYSRSRVERELSLMQLPSTVRAEELTLEQFARLYRSLDSQASSGLGWRDVARKRS